MSQKTDFFITVDIGSSRVVGAVVKKEANSKPEILYTSYKEVAFQSSLDIARYSTLVVASLDACLSDLQSHAQISRPTRALCTISSLIYEPTISLKEEQFSTETKITPDVLRELAGVVTTPQNKDVVSVEQTVMQIKLNGYPTANPLGRYAHWAQAAVYISVADKALVSKIQETVAKYFHGVKTEIHPFSFSAFTVIRDIVQDQNFICMDFGGEITDIVVAKNGILEKTISVPFGKNSILRELMDSMGVSIEVAESSLVLYNQEKLDTTLRDTVAKAIEVSREHWNTLFLGTLEHITLDLLLPRDMYVLSHQTVAPIIASFVQSKKYDRYVFVGQPFLMHQITDVTLAPFCITKAVSTAPDPFVMISSLFSAKLI